MKRFSHRKHYTKAELVGIIEDLQGRKKEAPERIGFFDIETTHLKANFGFILCYCIKDADTGKIFEHHISPKYLSTPQEDYDVVQHCIADLRKFDRIVTYYGTGFDIKFIRTRALGHGIDFPKFGEIYHTDCYYMVKTRLSLHSNRLDVACEEVLGKSHKTRLQPKIWRQAAKGDKEALQYIVLHCKADVNDLQKLYNKLIEFMRPKKASI